jgi:hypothetical protein
LKGIETPSPESPPTKTLGEGKPLCYALTGFHILKIYFNKKSPAGSHRPGVDSSSGYCGLSAVKGILSLLLPGTVQYSTSWA